MQNYEEKAKVLLDILLRPESFSPPQERVLAADMLIVFLPYLAREQLLMVCDRACAMSPLPLKLLEALIDKQQESVDLRLLFKGVDLPDFLLLKIMEHQQSHTLLSVASRRSVSHAVSAYILEHGSTEEIELLVRNQGALFSEVSFYRLAILCQKFPTLQAPLMNRPDLPPPIAFFLFWDLSSAFRRYITARFLSDSLTINTMIDLMPAPNPKGLEASFSEKTGLVLRKNGEQNEEASATLASALHISLATAQKILSDTGGEPLMVALKALRCSRKICEHVLDLLVEHALIPEGENTKEELKTFFETLSYNKARVLTLYWDWETQMVGPYHGLGQPLQHSPQRK